MCSYNYIGDCASVSIPIKMSTFFGNSEHPFRKSKAYLSEAECNCLFSTQAELLFHVW